MLLVGRGVLVLRGVDVAEGVVAEGVVVDDALVEVLLVLLDPLPEVLEPVPLVGVDVVLAGCCSGTTVSSTLGRSSPASAVAPTARTGTRSRASSSATSRRRVNQRTPRLLSSRPPVVVACAAAR